jgi:hypothetical protein
VGVFSFAGGKFCAGKVAGKLMERLGTLTPPTILLRAG